MYQFFLDLLTKMAEFIVVYGSGKAFAKIPEETAHVWAERVNQDRLITSADDARRELLDSWAVGENDTPK